MRTHRSPVCSKRRPRFLRSFDLGVGDLLVVDHQLPFHERFTTELFLAVVG